MARWTRKRWWTIAALVALSLPSLWFVCQNLDGPHFGVLQDDGLYFIGAKALAQDSGYRILSLPGEPFQTKYPPLYPLYLSLAWRINPSFPANLPIALILTWLCLPVLLPFVLDWCRRHRFTTVGAWTIVTLFAVNPYLRFFAANLNSELLFAVFLFASLYLAETASSDAVEGPRGRLVAAGVLAGAAYLVRTAGIAMIPAAVAYFLFRKQPRRAGFFLLGMLPAVAAWSIWGRLHAAPGEDIVTLVYTDYIGYQLLNVGLDNIAIVLWTNLSELLEAMGSLVFPQMISGLPAKLILQPIGLAMLLGWIRMAREGRGLLYILFAVVSLGMLLVWHFPPNQRFILPLAPLCLAGFYVEMSHLAELVRIALRHPDRSQRVVAYGFAGAVATVIVTGLGLQVYLGYVVVPELFADDRRNGQAFERMYRWIDASLPPEAGVVWEGDTRLYLSSGRHSASLLIPPRESVYSDDYPGDQIHYRDAGRYASEAGLGYVMLPTVGPHRDEAVLRAVAADSNLEKIHQEEGGVLYRVRPTQAATGQR